MTFLRRAPRIVILPPGLQYHLSCHMGIWLIYVETQLLFKISERQRLSRWL